jgi:hypothetical protein
MQSTHPGSAITTEETSAKKLRSDATLFVDSLTKRLKELENLAEMARKYDAFSSDQYGQFKQLFLTFGNLCQEFQLLNHLVETALADISGQDRSGREEVEALRAAFLDLQVPMLKAIIGTNLRLLRVWEDRLRCGEGLPYGSRELFYETMRIIDVARNELIRPRYLALLDEDALAEAEQADRLLKLLIKRTPILCDFVASEAIDDELMRLINSSQKRPK